jgi:hypothetical protein
LIAEDYLVSSHRRLALGCIPAMALSTTWRPAKNQASRFILMSGDVAVFIVKWVNGEGGLGR